MVHTDALSIETRSPDALTFVEPCHCFFMRSLGTRPPDIAKPSQVVPFRRQCFKKG